MFSVKDNRVFVAERFLEMGMDVNLKAKVSEQFHSLQVLPFCI